jgi:ubiquinone biosynthesis protein
MIAILLSIAIISPWFVSIPLIVVASLIALWRIVR